MKIRLKILVLFICFTSSRCEELELPICPTSVQFLPQNLPMHCRMPRNAKVPGLPEDMLPPFLPPQLRQAPDSPPQPPQLRSGQESAFPPGLPPGFIQGPPPGFVQGLPQGFPAGAMPMPMPMPAIGPPPPKVPVIVMPFYSPDPMFKKHLRGKRPPRYHGKKPSLIAPYHSDTSSDTDTDTDTDTDRSSDTSSGSSDEHRGSWRGGRGFKRNGRRSNRRHNRRHKSKRRQQHKRPLLTPILQYVTKDGYVMYEKKISNNEANDWLSVKKEMMKTEGNEQQMPEPRNIEVQFQGLEEEEGDAEAEEQREREKVMEPPKALDLPKSNARRHRSHKNKLNQHRNQKKTVQQR